MVSSALSAGVSAMQAATVRLAVAADNIVNANNRVPAPDDTTAYTGYEPRDVVDVATEDGVRATTRPVDPAYKLGTDGLGDVVAIPNVDLTDQVVTLDTASRAYEAAALVIRTSEDMQTALLDIVG